MFGLFDFLLIISVAGILTDYFIKKQKIQVQLLKEQVELEKIKHQNYLVETQKMQLELEKLQIEDSNRL